MFSSIYDIMTLLMLFSIFTSILIIINHKILFIFYIIYSSIIICNLIILEFKNTNIKLYEINYILLLYNPFKNIIKKPYEIISNIKDLYKSNYILPLYNPFKNIIKKPYEIISNIKDLYKSNYILPLYNPFKNIIKKTYEIILLIILSEIINDFEDLYKSDYIFSLYNIFKIIIIIKKSYEIINSSYNILLTYI